MTVDESSDLPPAARSARRWAEDLAPYVTPDLARSVFEVLITVLLLGAAWTGGWIAVSAGHKALALLMDLPAAVFAARLFILQHDCGHGSLFRSTTANALVGALLGTITWSPYAPWRDRHAIHHRNSGALDRRGSNAIAYAVAFEGDYLTHTVEEYRALPPFARMAYRLYRRPAVALVLGTALVYVVLHRFPIGRMRDGWRPWAWAMGSNAGLALFMVVVWNLGGWDALLWVVLPSSFLAAVLGMWLFHVQHQFESGYWAPSDRWNHVDAALRGASYLDLPRPLAWATANIGIHHLHHLNPRIPSYRLPEVLRDFPELARVNRVTLRDIPRCAGLALWDSRRQTMVSFRDIAG